VRPAVFLDRDGTMIHDVGYLRRLEEVRWFPSTIDAIRLLNRAGFLVCVTTNQSGVGRGYYTEADVAAVHAGMARTLEASSATVDGWFYCPHHPDAELADYRVVCDCRKPHAGMIRQAAARFAIDLSRSVVIGDKLLDVELAGQVGAQGVLVRTGYGDTTVRAHNGQVPGARFVAHELMEAASWVLGEHGHPKAAM
jgi:D-glycero-D-manno-heptose 1,7-bisphosphate phosphatase